MNYNRFETAAALSATTAPKSTLGAFALLSTDDLRAVGARFGADQIGLPLSVIPIPGRAELDNVVHTSARILVAECGHGERTYRLGVSHRQLHTAPNMIEIYEAGQSFDQCCWDGQPGRAVCIGFLDHDVHRLTHGQLSSLHLATQHEVFDRRISDLALELGAAAMHGLPNGLLHAQGICVALIGLLHARCEPPEAETPLAAPRRLSAPQVQRLVDLIEAEPGSRLTLTRLAAVAGMSPYHFLRVFTATFGSTPHQYVMHRRLSLAAAALAEKDPAPIANVASSFGFNSQAHLTTLMRQRLGVTPAQVRRGDGPVAFHGS